MARPIRGVWLAGLLLATCASVQAADLATPVSMESRWWSPREFGLRLGQATGLRFAVVDGISGRGRAGEEKIQAAQLAADFEKATGIRAEVINGCLLLHRPNEAKRGELEGDLAGGGERAVRAAWLLGWLKDAGAWPALARAACAKESAVALSAAQGLRRLDGEEELDLRWWVLGLYHEPPPDGGLWQAPLGACWKDPVSAAEVEALATSAWVPLREAAARLAPGCGEAGKALAGRLAADPSPLVTQAARRSLRTWESPTDGFKPVELKLKAPDLAAARAQLAKDPSNAKAGAAFLAAFGTDEDAKLLAATGVKGELAARAFAEVGGGEAALALLHAVAASARHGIDTSNHGTLPYGKYGLAMLLDGERLAGELGPLVGREHWGLSSEFLLARFAGPAGLTFLEKHLADRGWVAPLAIGYVGGPDAVRILSPLLEAEDLSTALAAARGLGETGLPSAVPPLAKALGAASRVMRSRAADALGRIGGPDSGHALADLLAKETQFIARRAAARMLREIADADKAHADLAAAVEMELAGFVPAYDPVNKQFGPEFAAGRWTDLKCGLLTVSSVGETRTAMDPYSGIFVRYGGCTSDYGNECVGWDAASGRWFIIRPPENLGMWGNERRACQGCSRGMTFDARSRLFWMDGGIGGSARPVNTWLYHAGIACYDVVLDRFDGIFPFALPYPTEAGATKWYVADSRNGLIVPQSWPGSKAGKMAVFDTARRQTVSREAKNPPAAGDSYPPDPQVYDPVSGRVLRRAREGLVFYDAATNEFGKSNSPAPPYAQVQQGGGMGYDAINREVIYFHTTGAWRYDREKDLWQQMAQGDCSANFIAYDAQHNVFLALKGAGLAAFRFKNVPVGTQAYYGLSVRRVEQRRADE